MHLITTKNISKNSLLNLTEQEKALINLYRRMESDFQAMLFGTASNVVKRCEEERRAERPGLRLVS